MKIVFLDEQIQNKKLEIFYKKKLFSDALRQKQISDS